MDFLNPGWITLFVITGLILLFFLYVVYQACYMIFGFMHSLKKRVLPQVRTDLDDTDTNIRERQFDLSSKSAKLLCKLHSGPSRANTADMENKLIEIVDAYLQANTSTSKNISSSVEILNSVIRVFVYYN